MRWKWDVQEDIVEISRIIREVLETTEEEGRRRRKKKRGWWNEEYRRKKKKVRRVLKKKRKREEVGQEFKRKKREYKELYERKKKEENERWEREAEEARTEGQVWELVNRERRRKNGINKDTEMGEWKKYFKGLLGRIEGWVIWEGEGEVKNRKKKV